MSASWWQRMRRLVQRPNAQAGNGVEHVRDMFQAHHDELAEKLRTLSTMSHAQLKALAEEVAQLDDATLQAHARDIHQAYARIRSASERADIALMSTKDLQTEWHDWERMEEFRKQRMTPEHEERKEMIRSELSVRGVPMRIVRSVETAVEPQSVIHEVVPALHVEAAAERPMPLQFIELDHLPEWEELFDEHAVLPHTIRDLLQSDEDHVTLMRQAYALKAAAGEQRRRDRLQGVRRVRVEFPH